MIGRGNVKECQCKTFLLTVEYRMKQLVCKSRETIWNFSFQTVYTTYIASELNIFLAKGLVTYYLPSQASNNQNLCCCYQVLSLFDRGS